MGKKAAYVALALAFLLIYGSVALSLGVDGEYELNEPLILLSLAFNVVLMVGAAALFVFLYHGGDIWKRLYVRAEGAVPAMALGAATAVAFMFVTGAVLVAAGYAEDNPLAEEIGANLGPLSLVLIPLFSAVSEEVFFRGLIHMHLEERTGFPAAAVGSSALFGLAHLSYGTVLQVLMPFAFGLLLAFLIHRYRTVVAPMAAHFTYNFVGLLAVYAAG
jgi:membrane protease YdiL (CAAX protease family)